MSDAETARVTRGFVDVCELLFPGRVRASYLTGSSADGGAVRTPGDALNSSDVDLLVVFKETMGSGEAERFRRARAACEALSGLGRDGLDATAVGEDALRRDGSASLPVASRLLFGEDIRDTVPLPSPDAHLRRAVRISTDVMATLRGLPPAGPGELRPPLAYPDPAGEFYGYDFRDPAYGGRPGTRLLLDGLTWGATALVVLRAGRCPGTKRDALRQYRQYVADSWSDLLDELYERCKLRWRYGIPAPASERQALRDLCRRVLPFENHLLGAYADGVRSRSG